MSNTHSFVYWYANNNPVGKCVLEGRAWSISRIVTVWQDLYTALRQLKAALVTAGGRPVRMAGVQKCNYYTQVEEYRNVE